MSLFLTAPILATLLLTPTGPPGPAVVQGTVTDAVTGQRLEDVKVTAEEESTGLSVPSKNTNGNGYYQLRVPPGEYTITFELAGYSYKRVQRVIVRPIPPKTLDQTLNPRIVTEAITVTADTPAVDPHQTYPVATVSLLSLEILRQGMDLFSDIGASVLSSGLGNVMPGAYAPQPELQMDGLPALPGEAGVAIGTGPLQIIEGLLPAEYGGGGAGVVLNLTNASLRNRVGLAAEASLQPGSLRNNEQPLAPPFQMRTRSTERSLQIEGGGAVVQDQLWSHVLFRRTGQEDQNRLTGDATGTANQSATFLNARVTGYATESLHLTEMVTVSRRNERGLIGDYLGHVHGAAETVQNQRAERSLVSTLSASEAYESATIKATLSVFDSRRSFMPITDELLAVPLSRDITRDSYGSGGPGFVVREQDRRGGNATGRVGFLAGSHHEITTGGLLVLQRNKLDALLSGDSILDTGRGMPIRRFYVRDGVAIGARAEDFRRFDGALFLQDVARLTNRLTLNAGVRWESFSARGEEIELETTSMLPRLGAAYDIAGNGRSVVTMGLGDYRQDLSNEDLFGLSSVYGIRALRGEHVASDIAPPRSAGHDLRAAVTREIAASYTQQLGVRWAASAHYGRRDTIDDIVLAPCDGTTCVGNPGRGLLSSHARAEREVYTLDVEFSSTDPLFPASLTYTRARHLGNSEPRQYVDTFFGTDPFFDLRRFTAGADDHGPLHADRRHRLSLAGEASFGKFVLGYNAYWTSGAPLSRYGYSEALGAWAERIGPRGAAGRTPTVYEAGVTAAYNIDVGRLNVRLRLIGANLLNAQRPLAVDERWSPANPHFGQAIVRTPPRSLTLFVRLQYE